MKAIRDSCVKYIVPVIGAVLAIFSYSYYQSRKQASDRAKESNIRHGEQAKEVEVTTGQVVEATADVKAAVAKVEEIKPVEVKHTDTMQESIDDFNKH
jgi:hypothetical protein